MNNQITFTRLAWWGREVYLPAKLMFRLSVGAGYFRLLLWANPSLLTHGLHGYPPTSLPPEWYEIYSRSPSFSKLLLIVLSPLASSKWWFNLSNIWYQRDYPVQLEGYWRSFKGFFEFESSWGLETVERHIPYWWTSHTHSLPLQWYLTSLVVILKHHYYEHFQLSSCAYIGRYKQTTQFLLHI